MNTFKIESAEFHSSHHDFRKIPENPTMPQAAFCGRSNAGKSSLINAILEKKELVKVSSTPGKTRCMNFFLLNRKMFFVDLPGFGYSKVSASVQDKMIEMVNGYLNHTETLKILFILLDSAREIPEEEKDLIQVCLEKNIQPVLIRTKIDKRNQKETAVLKKEKQILALEFPELKVIFASSKNGRGLEEIRNILSEFLYG
ncbi:MAG TPA: ribosome biogenesis GTP-binding protein YihA/YsxC [Leptospiraceae bacterium]|nr:ribosome biogenesis GTP-binding protein YihA/YsxC [Leptospiraceae bacterium]HNI25298.1 ribosome biogenesis GTP-binding protein YihA/YsxC [Leptospiraceae bacterium]